MLQQEAGTQGRKQILQTIFKSITLSPTGIRSGVRRHELVQRLLSRMEWKQGEQESLTADQLSDEAFVIERPMTIKDAASKHAWLSTVPPDEIPIPRSSI